MTWPIEQRLEGFGFDRRPLNKTVIKNWLDRVENPRVTKPRHRFGVLEGSERASGPAPREENPLEMRHLVADILSGRLEFTLMYQPIANIFGPRVIGYEVLSRFQSASGVRPDRVFLAANTMGVGAELEALVVTKALANRSKIQSGLLITINVTPALLDSPIVKAAFDQDLTGVVVELTEHLKIQDGQALSDSLNWLRARGAMIAMDDAGSGYAGLQMLTQVRPDIVKLDRELITGIDKDEVKALMCASFGDFVGRLDAWLLAEGVETRSELARIMQIGVPLVQGWGIGYPALQPENLNDDLTRWLSESAPSGDRVEGSLSSLMDPVEVWRDVDCQTFRESVPRVSQASACLIDSRSRITHLMVSSADGWVLAPVTLIAHRQERIREIATRAMARDKQNRFDPIVCTDDVGLPVGIVRFERVVSFLANIFEPEKGWG